MPTRLHHPLPQSPLSPHAAALQIDGTVRKADDRRKRARADKAARQAAEEAARQAEVRRLKNLKKAEIEEK